MAKKQLDPINDLHAPPRRFQRLSVRPELIQGDRRRSDNRLLTILLPDVERSRKIQRFRAGIFFSV